MTTQLLIPAAGLGERLGYGIPKALVPIEGAPLLVRTLTRFHECGLCGGAVVLVPPGHVAGFAEVIDAWRPNAGIQLIEGGATRQQSVRLGLKALQPETEVVIIHDAARPFVPPESILASVQEARAHGAATVAIPSVDTILEATADQFLEATPDRSRLWACQTPQTFRKDVIMAAHAAAAAQGFSGTDDATLVRWHGGPVRLVSGSRYNMKITAPEDVRLAKAMLREGLV